MLELHVHGGNAVVKAALAAIPKAARTQRQSVRYAEPGEFTRRAFYNSRLDLTEIEALGDTLAAETEQQRRLAVRGALSGLGERYEQWRQKLLYARGELEALIDFSEDQQFDEPPEVLYKSVTEQVKALRELLQTSIQNAFRGELLRNGISIALIGAPNAGKSSLLNRIVNREAAIVSREAGTTRDVIEIGVDIGGFYCRIGDLAGLRSAFAEGETPVISEIELEGMRRAREHTANADVVVVVLSVQRDPHAIPAPARVQISTEVEKTLRNIATNRQEVLYVINKSDLFLDDMERHVLKADTQGFLVDGGYPASAHLPFTISCLEGADRQSTGGIQAFMHGLTSTFFNKTSAILPPTAAAPEEQVWAESLGATERHRVLLQQCVSHLEKFLVEATEQAGIQGDVEIDVVLAAEHLRNAADCLSKITGKGECGDVEEVLGVVFKKYKPRSALKTYANSIFSFCVGK